MFPEFYNKPDKIKGVVFVISYHFAHIRKDIFEVFVFFFDNIYYFRGGAVVVKH